MHKTLILQEAKGYEQINLFFEREQYLLNNKNLNHIIIFFNFF